MHFSDGSVMRLYKQTVQDFCLYPGAELDEEQMQRLRAAASEMSAKMRAVRIVAASSVSVGELQQRLVHKGEDPEQAKKAVQWMEDLNLLDDSETARRIVESCARKGYGLARAKQALYEKRIPKELWEQALAEYPDQEEAVTEFLKARLSDSRDERSVRRATDALLRRGHSYALIRRCMQALAMDPEWIAEE